MKSKYAKSPSGDLVLLQVIACVLTTILVGCGARERGHVTVREAHKRVGDFAATAMAETLGGEEYGPKGRAMMQYRKEHTTSGTSEADPYPAWLAAVLLRAALDGTLFVQCDDKICLRLPWIAADSNYWYFGNVSVVASNHSLTTVLPPTALWRNFGAYVNSDSQVNEPVLLTFDYPLQSVESGDVLILDIHAIDRSLARYPDDIVFERVVDAGRHHLLRLQLPVIVRKP